MNNGVCLIHKGSKVPGRGSKNSVLTREFSRCNERQYNITQGKILPKAIFGCDMKTRNRKNDRSLSIFEYRNMQENLEHNRMVMGSYDRQSLVFFY